MRELIYAVVEAFYEKATNDVLIGYQFARFREPATLSHHLERITTFWEMQFTGQITKPLEGNPFRLMLTHLQLNIRRGELGRWVVLFHQTLDELEKSVTPEELELVGPLVAEWKKRIAFFEERFKSHPQMFTQK
jgi:truncated hemoglobin YjbI